MSLFDINNRSKPILKWAGGKSGLLHELIPSFPRTCNQYIEPFFGGGAVYLARRDKIAPSLLNDVNPEVINLYSVVRDFPEDLMSALDELCLFYSEAFYYQLRAEVPHSPVAQAARTIFLNKTGFNGLYRQNKAGGFNVPFGKRLKCPAIYNRANLLDVSRRLNAATLASEDFETVLDKAGFGDFVYCDPPYEPLSATSSFNTYHGLGFGQSDQIRLRDACVRAAGRGAFVAVSNSNSPFIEDIYSDWKIRHLMARRAINSKGTERGRILELLVILSNRSFQSKRRNNRQTPLQSFNDPI